MKTRQQLLDEKKRICEYRDKMADEYTRLVQLLLEYENEPEKYDQCVKQIEALEPDTKNSKEQMREINRALNELEKNS